MKGIERPEEITEVRSDFDNGEGYITIDAYAAHDNDEGVTVAVVNTTTAQVYRIDEFLCTSPLVQDGIREAITNVEKALVWS